VGRILTWLGVDDRSRLAAGAAALVVVATALTATLVRAREEPSIIIGKARDTATPLVTEAGPSEAPLPSRFRPSPLLGRSGHGPGAALAFRGAVDVPSDLLFFLVIGSDARPGQDMTRTRADSIHIAAVDPVIREGTIIGLPRDSYVNVPGHGERKINSALALGGPDLLVRTVRELTGLPISYYAVTAFQGIVDMANELRGVDINVPYRIDDRYSGAHFEPGWHHMDGNQVLAFTRARHGVPGGDFGRSQNQGRVIVHALEKLRAETRDERGIKHWLGILYKHARLDMSFNEAVRLGVLARQIVPSSLRNVVASGSSQNRGGQSVVVLDDRAYELFRDVGADAIADGRMQRESAPPTSSSTPTPTPKPSPTPAPPGETPLPTLPFPPP
jgi:LCP family protein required for cell wall assembly